MSPDQDFSQTGANSGIDYAGAFKKYKEMLTEDPDDPVYKRIFSEFNAALFGTSPTFSNDLVVDDGDYDSEIERFKNDLREEATANTETDKTPPIPSPLTVPLPSDPYVSISVTSHVSRTIAASSQVSNVINHSAPLPLEREVSEAPPPEREVMEAPSPGPADEVEAPPKPQRPKPRKPTKSSKASKSTPTTSDPGADAASTSTRTKRTTKQATASPTEPTRVLRNRA